MGNGRGATGDTFFLPGSQGRIVVTGINYNIKRVVPLCSLNRDWLVGADAGPISLWFLLVIYRTSFHGITTHL